jgi:hypothetical protein
MAPLHNLERRAGSIDLGNNEGGCVIASSSAVGAVHHVFGRGSGGLLGRTVCRAGWEVIDQNPELTRRRPKHHNTTRSNVWPSGWVVRKVANGPGFEPSAKGGVSSKRA